MSVTHVTAIRNGIADYVVDSIDGGSDFTCGNCAIYEDSTLLVTLDFAQPAFGNASDGTASAQGMPIENIVVTDGTANKFTFFDRTDPRNAILSGSVSDTGGSGDIKLSSVALNDGDLVRLTSLTYAAPV